MPSSREAAAKSSELVLGATNGPLNKETALDKYYNLDGDKYKFNDPPSV